MMKVYKYLIWFIFENSILQLKLVRKDQYNCNHKIIVNTKNKYLYLYFQKNIKIKQQQNSSWKNASLIKKYIYIYK